MVLITYHRVTYYGSDPDLRCKQKVVSRFCYNGVIYLFLSRCKEGVSTSLPVDMALELMFLLFHYRLFYDRQGRVASSTCPIAPLRKVETGCRYFGNWTFRSQDHSLPGAKVPAVELLLPGTFAPWNFRC